MRKIALLVLVGSVSLLITARAAQESGASRLIPDKTLQREISGGQIHLFLISLSEGQLLRTTLSSSDIDLLANLYDSTGQKLLTCDLLKYPGPESFSFEAPKGGEYRLEVLSDTSSLVHGHYELTCQINSATDDASRQRLAAERLLNEAVVSEREGSKEGLEKAIAKSNAAQESWHKLGDRYWEAYSLHFSGRLLSSLGNNRAALECYEKALGIRKEIADRLGEASTLNNIGVAFSSLGDKQKALDYYSRALLIRQTLGFKSGQAATLINIGVVYSDLGEKRKALAYYDQALPILRAIGDRQTEAMALSNIGLIYADLGEKKQALLYYEQALPALREVGNRNGEGMILSNMGFAYSVLGERQKALDCFSRALLLLRAVGNRNNEANTLLGIGTVYLELAELQKALDYYDQALRIKQLIGDKGGEATTLSGIANIYLNVGNARKALEFHNQALPILRVVGDRRAEAMTLDGIARAYSYIGEKNRALEYYQQALQIRRSVEDPRGEAATLNNIGSVYLDLGEYEKAHEYYYQSLAIVNAVGDRGNEVIALRNLMYSWKIAEPTLAIFYGKEAVNVVQELRGDVGSLDKELQKTFLKATESTYRLLAELLLSQDRVKEAHQILNLFKDQQFFDFDRDQQTPILHTVFTPREISLDERYKQIVTRLEVQAQAKKIVEGSEFAAFFKQAESEFGGSPSEKDRILEVSDTRTLQGTLRDLKRQTGQQAVAVYTLVGTDSLHALLITEKKITAVTEPIKGNEVNKKALQLWGLLQTDKYDPRPLARDLYSVLFKPIEAKLPKHTATILWSLDGNLRYVPMGALYDGKRYLIERYSHVVFTRPDSERLLQAVSSHWSGLGLGSSRAHTVELLGEQVAFNALPGVTEELRVLFGPVESGVEVLKGEVFRDEKFTRKAMIHGLQKKPSLVHISSHFSFRPGDEARSFLLLGDGSAMTLKEMKSQTKLFAGVELLTLSACNTAAQQPGADGREIDGFAELAQRLGARAVMATLWPVADNSTPWLMRDFYQKRQQGKGLTKAEALRRSQLALINGAAEATPNSTTEKGFKAPVEVLVGSDSDKREESRAGIVYISERDAPLFQRNQNSPFSHPYYWAPFILIGNWK